MTRCTSPVNPSNVVKNTAFYRLRLDDRLLEEGAEDRDSGDEYAGEELEDRDCALALGCGAD